MYSNKWYFMYTLSTNFSSHSRIEYLLFIHIRLLFVARAVYSGTPHIIWQGMVYFRCETFSHFVMFFLIQTLDEEVLYDLIYKMNT